MRVTIRHPYDLQASDGRRAVCIGRIDLDLPVQDGATVLHATLGENDVRILRSEGLFLEPTRYRPDGEIEVAGDVVVLPVERLTDGQRRTKTSMEAAIRHHLRDAVLVDDRILVPLDRSTSLVVRRDVDDVLRLARIATHGRRPPNDEIVLPWRSLPLLVRSIPGTTIHEISHDDLTGLDPPPAHYARLNLPRANDVLDHCRRRAPEMLPARLRVLADAYEMIDFPFGLDEASDEEILSRAEISWNALMTVGSTFPERPDARGGAFYRGIVGAALAAQFDRDDPERVLELLLDETDDWAEDLEGSRPDLSMARFEGWAAVLGSDDKLRCRSSHLSSPPYADACLALSILAREARDLADARGLAMPALDLAMHATDVMGLGRRRDPGPDWTPKIQR